ncbi:hypothetical protein ACP0F6_25660, partial [Escherichia coli]
MSDQVATNTIHEHNFSRLRHTQPEDFPVEKLASFAVMQLMLNRKRTARAVLTGMCYSAGSAMRHGSS